MDEENVIIDWSKYVDAIYCLHYIPYDKRLGNLVISLNYFDILNSEIFDWYLTFPNVFDEIIANHINPTYRDFHNERRQLSINVSLAYHNMFRQIQELGLEKVLIIEDDCAFLQGRKKLLLDTLEHLPENWDYIQFDKVRAYRPEYAPFLKTLVDGEWFCSNYTGGYWGTTFTFWSKKAIDIAVKKLETEMPISDHLLVNRNDSDLDGLNRFVPHYSFIYQPNGLSLYSFV